MDAVGFWWLDSNVAPIHGSHSFAEGIILCQCWKALTNFGNDIEQTSPYYRKLIHCTDIGIIEFENKLSYYTLCYEFLICEDLIIVKRAQSYAKKFLILDISYLCDVYMYVYIHVYTVRGSYFAFWDVKTLNSDHRQNLIIQRSPFVIITIILSIGCSVRLWLSQILITLGGSLLLSPWLLLKVLKCLYQSRNTLRQH